MRSKINIAVSGARGRLGRQICEHAAKHNDLNIAQMLARKDQLADGFDLLIDVSMPQGVIKRVMENKAHAKPVVIGVTGFDPSQLAIIEAASKSIPVLLSGNFSLGIHSLLAQVKANAQKLGSAASFQIEEIHHIGKKDYPSGTALMLARAISHAVGRELPVKSTLSPQKPTLPAASQINIHCIRKGAVIGSHFVTFTLQNEKVVLGHTAKSRDIYADGALTAARWLVGQKPGLYGMQDVPGH